MISEIIIAVLTLNIPGILSAYSMEGKPSELHILDSAPAGPMKLRIPCADAIFFAGHAQFKPLYDES